MIGSQWFKMLQVYGPTRSMKVIESVPLSEKSRLSKTFCQLCCELPELPKVVGHGVLTRLLWQQKLRAARIYDCSWKLQRTLGELLENMRCVQQVYECFNPVTCDSPFNYFRRAEIVWTMTLWATGSIKAFYSLPFWISGAQSGTTCNLSNQHLTSFLWLSTPCTHGAASGDSRNCWNEYIRKFVSLWSEAKDGWS